LDLRNERVIGVDPGLRNMVKTVDADIAQIMNAGPPRDVLEDPVKKITSRQMRQNNYSKN
jgi:hypothetical protein